MTDWDDEIDLRRRAERAADAKLALRAHVFSYLLVVGGLLALNLVTSPGYLWVGWVAFGWGIGVVSHAAAVYLPARSGRERLIQAEMARLRDERR